MNESEVADHVRRWLHENNKSILIDGTGGKYTGVDFTVGTRDSQDNQKPTEQIECKGEGSDIYKPLGQCLYYRFHAKIPTYLAVPQSLPFINELVGIIEYFNLPIGLLLIDEKGKVLAKRRVD